MRMHPAGSNHLPLKLPFHSDCSDVVRKKEISMLSNLLCTTRLCEERGEVYHLNRVDITEDSPKLKAGETSDYPLLCQLFGLTL